MVGNVTSLTNNGLRDWLIQRITSLVIALYSFFLIGFLVLHPQLRFSEWQPLFELTWMRIFTLLSIVSIVWHAWIGIWTVTTEYLPHLAIRLIVQVLVATSLIACFFWSVMIIWGV